MSVMSDMSDMCENTPFEYFQDDSKMALFINSEAQPHESQPLDIYSYGYSSYNQTMNNMVFSRLHKDTYIFIDPKSQVGIKHNILTWYPIEVKSNCKEAMKLMIDSAKSFEEFIIK